MPSLVVIGQRTKEKTDGGTMYPAWIGLRKLLKKWCTAYTLCFDTLSYLCKYYSLSNNQPWDMDIYPTPRWLYSTKRSWVGYMKPRCGIHPMACCWISTSIFDKVPRSFTWLAYWRHGITRDCKWSTMTLEVASLIRRSSRKQHGTENNRSWLSTCSQVIRPWHLKVQHGMPCHTFKKLDVFYSIERQFQANETLKNLAMGYGNLSNGHQPIRIRQISLR